MLLLDEPTTGVDPVSRREFWDTLAHLAAEGLTILLATPYLDEAERCHRVALMHQGEIRQIGTPPELRSRLACEAAWSCRPAIWAKAESLLHPIAGKNREIIDVQRFGDRLDVLVRDPDVAGGEVAAGTEAAGWRSSESASMSRPWKILSSRRCANLGEEVHDEPFPGRRDNAALKGQIAIGATDLTKQFGSFTAVKHVTAQVRYGEIYGLLGANGAGKTTTIKMLCGLLEPTSGDMELAGSAASLRSPEVRQKIGYMSQKFSLYNDMSIDENLRLLRRRLRRAGGRDRREEELGAVVFGSRRQGRPDYGEPAAGLETARRLRRGDSARAERAVPR